jgi:hypothetical protein
MDATALARLLVVVGLGLVVLGAVVYGLGRVVDLGSLPGDITYEQNGTRVYVPLTTMLVVSLVLTLLVNLVLRLWR